MSGSVCDFVYVTSGFSLLWSLLLLVPTLLALRRPRTPYLDPIVPSLCAFAVFWWVVCSITISIRGEQAGAEGLAGSSARQGAAALAWGEVLLFFVNGVAGIVDRTMAYKQAVHDKSRALLEMEHHDQYRATHVHTRIGNTPLA